MVRGVTLGSWKAAGSAATLMLKGGNDIYAAGAAGGLVRRGLLQLEIRYAAQAQEAVTSWLRAGGHPHAVPPHRLDRGEGTAEAPRHERAQARAPGRDAPLDPRTPRPTSPRARVPAGS